jgi:hypothetical protein
MNFPNGISAQTCYAMAVPADQAAKLLREWIPQPFPELKVFGFHMLHAPPEPADFQSLDFRSSQGPVRWLLGKTIDTKSELNLSHDEAQQLSCCLPKGSAPAKVAECWDTLVWRGDFFAASRAEAAKD